MQGNPYYPSLGDTAGARASYDKELKILLALSANDPSNAKIKRKLALAYNRIGSCLDAAGDYQRSLENAQKALSINRELAASDDPKARDLLAYSLNNVGLQLRRIGNTQGSLENYREAADVRPVYSYGRCEVGLGNQEPPRWGLCWLG